MAQDPSMKRPLTSGQFAWAISKKSGVFSVIIGPDPMDATDDELFVVPSRREPTKVEQADSSAAAIQDFILIKPGEYAVIHNPTESFTADHPNGPYTKGRGDVKALRHGTKRVVTTGYFPVWPGQQVEVREIHTLSSNQFLMAVVESDLVDESSPYYDITVRCATIKKAMVNRNASKKVKLEDLENEEAAAELEPVEEKMTLKMGQRIIIPGNLTPTYIPPSGIEIVPEYDTVLGNHHQSFGRDGEYAQAAPRQEMVRQAVVLGPTEFCVLMDEDGQPQVKRGPGRVFPGPYDTFRTKGSRNCAYDAYHLRPDRGLLLRVVDDSIAKESLAGQLPAGSQLDKGTYTKGDEIFIHGFDAYIIPSSSIEVIDPKTRTPHVGNDHSTIYVQAIGVDQKSGIYVANVETGNVNLVHGEKKMILDPRKERHVVRKVPVKMWNLIIGKGEPHKAVYDEQMVNTPWALSVVIPNNEAVLVTSKDGRRPVVGPKTILLGFEEWLEVLRLSRGRPKNDRDALETCFLRMSGNRISDLISLETSDYVKINVSVQYSVEFEGKTVEEQIQWFNYKDYVKFFCSNLRSRLRASARKITLSKLYSNMADFVRDTILGEKPETGHRLGMLFKENNMRVTEVDVLVVEIPDPEISMSFLETNRTVVVTELKLVAEEVELETEKRLSKISEERSALELEKIDRLKGVKVKGIVSEQETYLLSLKNAMDRLKKQEEQEDLKSQASINRMRINSAADSEIRKRSQDNQIEFQSKVAELERLLITAGSEADVKRLTAIQPEFIKAIEGLGDKQALAELAHHLPSATGELGFLLGQGGIAGLAKMLDGTPFSKALKGLTDYSSEEK
jgi:hypothetical protein